MAVQRKQTSATINKQTKSTKSDDVSELSDSELEKMSLKEKISFFDRELRKLNVFCLNSGYSAADIESFTTPFFESRKKASFDKWAKRCVAALLLIGVFVILIQFDPVYRFTCALFKRGAIALLPLWDWTQVHHSPCLLTNPMYKNPYKLVLDDCQICEGIQNIRQLSNIDPATVVEQYFKRDIPIIVSDGLKDWGNLADLSIYNLAQMYQSNDTLKSYGGCGFSSNVRIKYGGHRDLLKKVLKENITEFYAHWENCQRPAAKVFRSVYKRPYFLPSAVETSSTNWIFISSNYSGKLFKEVEIEQPLVMFMQVAGKTQILVDSWKPCNEVCLSQSSILHAGEILVITDYLWKVSYLPLSNEETIAIGIGGSF